MRSRMGALCTTIISVLVLGACTGNAPLTATTKAGADGSPTKASFARFGDIPVPRGAEMDVDRSLVLGEQEAWIGRLVMWVPESPGRMYDFFSQEMPRFAWDNITSVRSAISVMTYTRGDRVATIQIKDSTIRGSVVWMTMSPRGSTMPRAASANGGIVTAQPLR